MKQEIFVGWKKNVFKFSMMLFAVLLFLCPKSTEAATIIKKGQHIMTNTVWTSENSPYIVEDFVQIFTGMKLSIGSGVIVKMHKKAAIYSRGAGTLLEIKGTSEAPVIFTSVYDDSVGGDQSPVPDQTPVPGIWGDIGVDYGGKLNIDNAIFRYGGTDPGWVDGLSVGVIFVWDGTVSVTNSVFTQNIRALFNYWNTKSVVIHDSKIFGNSMGGIYNNSYGAVDALNNWWGDESGPYEISKNPFGRGDKIGYIYSTNKVAYDPWVGKYINQSPTLSYSQENNYKASSTLGVSPAKGEAGLTDFAFKVVYSDADNDAPTSIAMVIQGDTATSSFAMSVDDAASTTATLRDGSYVDGEQFTVSEKFPQGKYKYYFVASNEKHSVRWPLAGELEFETGYSNILFLPGLEASRLYRQGAIFEDQLWEPNNDADVEDLYLDATGKSIKDDIYTRDAIKEVNLTLLGRKNIYLSFSEDLKHWKEDEKIINDYAVAPYDWRLSLEDILNSGVKAGENISYNQATTEPYIVKELRRLAGTSKSGKVTIIAHSNGGLLTKALIGKLGTDAESLIDKIIFVAVPQTGTPQAIGGILHGYDQGLPTDFFSFFLSPRIARQLAANMPSAYHLLPSKDYFNDVMTPVIKFENGEMTNYFTGRFGLEIDSFDELKNFLLEDYNKIPADSDNLENPSIANHDLVAYAENIHQLIDNQIIPASIEVHQIAGWGEETLSSIKYWTGDECGAVNSVNGCASFQKKLQYTPEITIDGDGTVLAPSALVMSTSTENVRRWWVDLEDYDYEFHFKREHAAILEVAQLRDFIKNNILTKSTTDLPTYIYNTKPSRNISGNKLQYILHSPLNLSIRDNDGHRVNSATSTIPGARFKRFGEVQYLSVPAGTPHTVELDGTGTGSFTLEMREVENDLVIATTTFAAIPSATGTRVTMIVPSGTIQSAQDLNIDYNNDGLADYSLTPKVGETVMPPIDQTAPEAKLYFNPDSEKLTIEAIDESPTTITYTKERLKKHHDYSIKAVIKDSFDNTTIITYTEKGDDDGKIKIELRDILYNGQVSSVKAEIDYQWKKKRNNFESLSAHLEGDDSELESHYRRKKNMTIIMSKPRELDDHEEGDDEYEKRSIREKRAGLVIPGIQTNQGKIDIYY